jgi:hypothetical protein
MMVFRLAKIASLALICFFFAENFTVAVAAQTTTEHVPFVGCASDGQVGPQDAPTRAVKSPWVSKTDAAFLAFYQDASGDGVLAPRGWYCSGYYGSSGRSLTVSPDPATGKDSIATTTTSLKGPGINVGISFSGTSGRFEVAQIVARLFPSHMNFAKNVINEGFMPASDFPLGPHPDDILTWHNANDVEFETPANKTGMGTDGLSPGSDPIFGEAILVDEGALVVDVRLPLELQMHTETILQGVRDNALATGNLER